ncbi:hypothetical protein GOBAR_DD27304 [Gossypium barbadense]|nr:hypothetical protein GOBAR_DD27304 [Gossypium barbadense]
MVAATNGAEQIPTETIRDIVEELLEAARYDDLDDLIRLASIGVSLDSKDSHGRTVFYLYHDKVKCGLSGSFIGSCFRRGEKDAVACFEILNPFIAQSFDLGGGVRV